MANRVKQISIDIVVGEKVDGVELSEEILYCLEENGYNVVGVQFNDDLTEIYKKDYPELLK